jgi:hypothetical protein
MPRYSWRLGGGRWLKLDAGRVEFKPGCVFGFVEACSAKTDFDVSASVLKRDPNGRPGPATVKTMETGQKRNRSNVYDLHVLPPQFLGNEKGPRHMACSM